MNTETSQRVTASQLKRSAFLYVRQSTPRLDWGDLEHNRVTRLLRNPRYAGAFFYGRTRSRRSSTAEGRTEGLIDDGVARIGGDDAIQGGA